MHVIAQTYGLEKPDDYTLHENIEEVEKYDSPMDWRQQLKTRSGGHGREMNRVYGRTIGVLYLGRASARTQHDVATFMTSRVSLPGRRVGHLHPSSHEH